MLLGYNSNGFAHHRLSDTVAILYELGYRGLGLTLDVHHLNPFAAEHDAEVQTLRGQLSRCEMRSVVETGARFLLDPRRKHQPTLLDSVADQRTIRRRFLENSIEIAHKLSSDCVSFWAGTPMADEPRPVLLARLVEECSRLADFAAARGVKLAFEPEPGMLIETMEQFAELERAVNHPAFGLTLDIGHLVCLGELPVSRHMEAWQHKLWNIHIEDMKSGIHDHIAFGEGDVDFHNVFSALSHIKYQHGIHVELSRHGHDAVRTATRSMTFLQQFVTVVP